MEQLRKSKLENIDNELSQITGSKAFSNSNTMRIEELNKFDDTLTTLTENAPRIRHTVDRLSTNITTTETNIISQEHMHALNTVPSIGTIYQERLRCHDEYQKCIAPNCPDNGIVNSHLAKHVWGEPHEIFVGRNTYHVYKQCTICGYQYQVNTITRDPDTNEILTSTTEAQDPNDSEDYGKEPQQEYIPSDPTQQTPSGEDPFSIPNPEISIPDPDLTN